MSFYSTIHIVISCSMLIIDEKDRKLVFEKYSQIDSGKYHSRKNFGLGLTFSKLAVELLGGKIGIECEKENLKTIFYFTIKNGKD